jgi:SAM-dependent methyltransferase
MAPTPPATPKRLRRSSYLSTFAHLGAVYLFHDLYGYLMQMSPDVLAVVDAFEGGADTDAVAARFAGAFEGASAEQFIPVFFQHACLVEPDEDEREALWPMVAIKGKWNVWRRQGDRVTLWTAWGDGPVRRIELDEADTRIWDDLDGERRLAQLRERHDPARVMALVGRLTHSDVQALKLNMFPASTFAKRPQMAPPYLSSTMPYRRWTPADGAPWDDHGTQGREVSPLAYYRHGVADADAQFDHQETTLSHLFRRPHPALGGRTYGAALVDALAARGRVPADGPLRVLEIGAGLGYVAEAVLGALAARGVAVEYTIAELAPELAAAQRERLAGRDVRWVMGDVLAAELPAGRFDWILGNEMIGDLPALRLSRPDLGLALEGSGTVDPSKLAALGPAGERVARLGIFLDDATEPLYLMTGAFELVEKIAGWLAPGGTAVLTEFGEPGVWPKLSTHLDHPELSIHFGQLQQAARGAGLDGEIVFVMDLLDLDRDAKGLATTRSHFRALRAMLADAGVALEKIGYTPALLEEALAGKLALADLGELRFEKIEDRLMGLVPHEFKALLCYGRTTGGESPSTAPSPSESSS